MGKYTDQFNERFEIAKFFQDSEKPACFICGKPSMTTIFWHDEYKRACADCKKMFLDHVNKNGPGSSIFDPVSGKWAINLTNHKEDYFVPDEFNPFYKEGKDGHSEKK
jgi:hypothetical protein